MHLSCRRPERKREIPAGKAPQGSTLQCFSALSIPASTTWSKNQLLTSWSWCLTQLKSVEMEKLNFKKSDMKPNITIYIGILWFILYKYYLTKFNICQEQGCELTLKKHTKPTIRNVYHFHHSWQITLNHFKWAGQFLNIISLLRHCRSSKQIQKPLAQDIAINFNN